MTWEIKDDFFHDLGSIPNTYKFQLSDLLNKDMQLYPIEFSEIMLMKVVWKL